MAQPKGEAKMTNDLTRSISTVICASCGSCYLNDARNTDVFLLCPFCGHEQENPRYHRLKGANGKQKL